MSSGYEYDPEYGGDNYDPNNCDEVSLPPEIAPVEQPESKQQIRGKV